ncbi:unnamed protein product [Didymodactylos carnosus]|uniref:Exocyst complex component 7 n=1 Tax=Didymodactylos carnosus TaxID=1234261 RepID=A0A813T6A5_9BILA|nr:unnamed protein product [Didymodactylos carnosus]CAF0921852.1 unnamed protein product [Didymodactylos carnosus]CAF3593633.1 unnamed protein product [Didymodactylos carnosus]CAF3699264.1 unnamed protein product [Didymodactylos carnosus]
MTVFMSDNASRSSESKLQEEKKRLSMLKDALQRSNNLTHGMISTLDNFERKLNSLDDIITPVYDSTNELRLLLTNVEKTLSVCDSVLHYYDVCSELNSTISSGPGGNIIDYLKELEKLEDAVKYFKRVSAQQQGAVSERERVNQLYDLGRRRLLDETDKLIMRYSNPLQAKEVLDLLDQQEQLSANNSSSNSSGFDLQSMQEADLQALRTIIEWFSKIGFRQGLVDLYANRRGTMMRRSLQLLSEYLRSTSVRRLSTSLTYSPNIRARDDKGDTMNRRAGRKIGRKFIRSPAPSKAHLPSNYPIMEEPQTPNSPSSSQQTSVGQSFNLTVSGAVGGQSDDDRETNNYKLMLDSFLILLNRDRDMLQYVFPQELTSLVFTKLAELPLVYMKEEAQRICDTIERTHNKLESKFCVFGQFSVLQWFFKSRQTFSKLYQESDAARRQQFTTLSATFEQSAVSCLRHILDEIKLDSSPPSVGGNVHPLTSHVLAFMEGLLNFEETATIIASLYVDQEQKSSNTPVETNEQKGQYDLGKYFCQLIRWLHVTISKKADLYQRNDTTIRAIFLLNNANYLLKRLENSSLLSILQKYQPDLKSKYEADFHTNIGNYIKCYSPLIIAIQQMLEYDNSQRLPDTKLREKDREQLKDSFNHVNSAIDSLRSQCQEYIISDIDLRHRLRQDGKAEILESFRKYYQKFAHKEFTKNPNKYLRYSPETLERIIDEFFEMKK